MTKRQNSVRLTLTNEDMNTIMSALSNDREYLFGEFGAWTISDDLHAIDRVEEKIQAARGRMWATR